MDDLNTLEQKILSAKSRVARLAEMGPVPWDLMEDKEIIEAESFVRKFERKVEQALAQAERAALSAL